MIGNIEELGKQLQGQADIETDIYDGEHHGSVAFRALTDGLRFVQKHWQQQSTDKH